jgi:hypothetical protein
MALERRRLIVWLRESGEAMNKLVVGRTLADAFRLTLGNWRRLVRLAEPWMTAVALAEVIVAGLALLVDSPPAVLAMVIPGVPLLLGLTVFAVALHRAILIGEPTTAPPPFHFGRREARYLGYMLGLILLVLVVSTVAALPLAALAAIVARTGDASGSLARGILVLANVISFFAGALCFGRLALVLPAAAIDGKAPLLLSAWTRGRGNTLRLMFGAGLGFLAIGMLVLLYVILLLSLPIDDVVLLVVLQLPLIPLNFLQIAVPVAYLSLAYRQIVGITA